MPISYLFQNYVYPTVLGTAAPASWIPFVEQAGTAVKHVWNKIEFEAGCLHQFDTHTLCNVDVVYRTNERLYEKI